MKLFSAVLIGGPPHSGKSVLAYSLTQALRAIGIDHYVLRAYPDGEGDWANETAQELVQRIRIKGHGTPQWTDRICRDIAHRHLPLVVDIGGQPTPDQERVLDNCTHGIVLAPTIDAQSEWVQRLARHNLPLLARLTSQRAGVDQIVESTPILVGTLTGLERGALAQGTTFEALVERIAELFACDPAELRREHFSCAPTELVIDLDRLAHTLGVSLTGNKADWRYADLPRVLDYLPEATPISLYGRGPNWLYAAVACLTQPSPFYQFDPRLGWVQAMPLTFGPGRTDEPLQLHVAGRPDHSQVEGSLPEAYIDYAEVETLTAPPLPTGHGVVLSGKLPQWLYTSLAITYRGAAWIAVGQPQRQDAVIVYSQSDDLRPGDVWPESNRV